MKEVGQIKMSVGVIAYNQLMLVCQVNLFSSFSPLLGSHGEGYKIWTLDDILYLYSDVDWKILKFVQLVDEIRILWKKGSFLVSKNI